MTQDAQAADPRIIWPREHPPRSAAVYTKNTIDISAAPEIVWALLIDCLRWPSWYQHCSDVSILRGGPLLGIDSKFRFKTLGFYGEPEIKSYQPAQMLVWSAKGLAGLSGSHAWYIEPRLDGCRVITEEVQIGWVLWLLRPYLQPKLLAMHEDWLVALKRLSEVEK